MTEGGRTETSPSVEIVGNASAPFVFFDMAATHGVDAGIVTIELIARTIIPDGHGKTRNEIVVTGHLRTSLAGAESLRRAINELELLLTPVANPDGPKN